MCTRSPFLMNKTSFTCVLLAAPHHAHFALVVAQLWRNRIATSSIGSTCMDGLRFSQIVCDTKSCVAKHRISMVCLSGHERSEEGTGL